MMLSHRPLSHGPVQQYGGKEQLNHHRLVNRFPVLAFVSHYGTEQLCAAETSGDGSSLLPVHGVTPTK